jgi:glutathione reductase (NADPH)
MVYASTYTQAMKQAAAYGWDVKIGVFDWASFREKLEGELDRLEGIYRQLLENADVDTFDCRATVAGLNEVQFADGRKVTAKTILVATGGWPVVPNIPGAQHVITSNEIFHLNTLPKRILIVGGGYIACEFAGIMNGLGVETHLWYRGNQILRGFDGEARGVIEQGMLDRGVHVVTEANVVKIINTDDCLEVTDLQGQVQSFDVVMFATGRTPNSANLGLEALGIELDSKGAVDVDQYSATAVSSIYAIGDVTNRVNLTPVALYYRRDAIVCHLFNSR